MFEEEVQNAVGMKRRGVGVGGGQRVGAGWGGQETRVQSRRLASHDAALRSPPLPDKH